jgi:hypothetical protein
MPYIAVRDPFADAKDTLSSWDKCMAKTYCKSVAAASRPSLPRLTIDQMARNRRNRRRLPYYPLDSPMYCALRLLRCRSSLLLLQVL